MPESAPAELTAAQWRMRALSAESAARHALFMETSGRLVSPDGKDTFRGYLERVRPELLVRNTHRPIEVYRWADACDCDPDADDYEDTHSEAAGDADGYLCSRGFLGHVCETCTSEDHDGPEWKPGAVQWPCPSITTLNAARTETEMHAVARKLLTPSA